MSLFYTFFTYKFKFFLLKWGQLYSESNPISEAKVILISAKQFLKILIIMAVFKDGGRVSRK